MRTSRSHISELFGLLRARPYKERVRLESGDCGKLLLVLLDIQVISANDFSQSARKEISEIEIHTMWQRALK